ncbi:unnamed protein product, partial [Ectocarpus sp. 12 AP-2014]
MRGIEALSCSDVQTLRPTGCFQCVNLFDFELFHTSSTTFIRSLGIYPYSCLSTSPPKLLSPLSPLYRTFHTDFLPCFSSLRVFLIVGVGFWWGVLSVSHVSHALAV